MRQTSRADQETKLVRKRASCVDCPDTVTAASPLTATGVVLSSVVVSAVVVAGTVVGIVVVGAVVITVVSTVVGDVGVAVDDALEL